MKRILALLIVLLLACGTVFFFAIRPAREMPFVIGKPLPPGGSQPQIAAGRDGAYLLAPDGSIWVWGGSRWWQADLQIGLRTEVPLRIGTNTDWVAISAGLGPVLAIKADGSLWGWGDNSSGGLSPGGSNLITRPVQIGTYTDWARISVGAAHCMALRRDGSLWVWGGNKSGQVGNGGTSPQPVPLEVMPGTRWKAIAAGAFNSYALCEDGTVWGWGLDPHTGGRQNNLNPVQIGSDSNWVAIAAGDFHLLALKSDGTVWIHGQNAHVASGGSVPASEPVFIQLGEASDWEQMHCGQNNSYLRKSDGSWWVCGSNDHGQLGYHSYGRPTIEIVRCPIEFDPWAFDNGISTAILLARDGTLWTWGERLGAPRRRDLLKEVVELVASALSKGQRRRDTTTPVTDAAPHKVWELPEEMKQQLGNQ